MTLRQVLLYLEHVPTIQAQEALLAVTVASAAAHGGEFAESVVASWREMAGLPPHDRDDDAEKITFEDFQMLIKRPLGT